MRSIFIGLIFISLNFNLNIGNAQIGLIPDFIGYIIMLRGLKELAPYSARFVNAQPRATGMMVYTAILYGLNLLGIPTSLGQVVDWALSLVATGVSLYISYEIVMGVRDIEKSQARNLNGANLFTVWKAYAILSLAIHAFFLIPALNIVLVVAGLITSVVYLITFNKTKNLYEQP